MWASLSPDQTKNLKKGEPCGAFTAGLTSDVGEKIPKRGRSQLSVCPAFVFDMLTPESSSSHSCVLLSSEVDADSTNAVHPPFKGENTYRDTAFPRFCGEPCWHQSAAVPRPTGRITVVGISRQRHHVTKGRIALYSSKTALLCAHSNTAKRLSSG